MLQIIVTAKDNGYPLAKRSTCRLLVTVSDTNDNAPVFINPSENDASVYATILRDDVITRIEVLRLLFDFVVPNFILFVFYTLSIPVREIRTRVKKYLSGFFA